jgi:hypothetical protein
MSGINKSMTGGCQEFETRNALFISPPDLQLWKKQPNHAILQIKSSPKNLNGICSSRMICKKHSPIGIQLIKTPGK